MKIAFVLYDSFTALDLVGPYEVLANWPGSEVRFVATDAGPIRADAGLTVSPTDTPESLPDPDIVIVPGSSNPLGPLADEALLEWVSADRVVFDDPFVSGAGVSAGIDMALALTERVHGAQAAKIAQLAIEYDPQPPCDAGSPEKAGPEVVQATIDRLAAAVGVSEAPG